MGKGIKKTKPIAELRKILFTVGVEDRAPLAYIEAHLAKEAGFKDVMDYPTSKVIRYCIHKTYNQLANKRSKA